MASLTYSRVRLSADRESLVLAAETQPPVDETWIRQLASVLRLEVEFPGELGGGVVAWDANPFWSGSDDPDHRYRRFNSFLGRIRAKAAAKAPNGPNTAEIDEALTEFVDNTYDTEPLMGSRGLGTDPLTDVGDGLDPVLRDGMRHEQEITRRLVALNIAQSAAKTAGSPESNQ